MKNLIFMYIFRFFVICSILFYINFTIENLTIRIVLWINVIVLVSYYFKNLRIILKPISYFIFMAFLAFLFANIIYIKNNKKIEIIENNNTNKILIIRDTIKGDNSNLALGKVLNGKLKNKLVVIYTDIDHEFRINQMITTNSKIKIANSNITSFDMMFFGNVNYQLNFPKVLNTEDINKFSLLKIISFIRDKIDENIKKTAGIKNYNLISMWLLGKTKTSNNELNNLFKNIGISHILVISGTHLTILFNISSYLLVFVLGGGWISLIILALFLILFLFLTGCSSSILRATIFWLILILARAFNKIINYTNALLLILFMFFIINPKAVIFDIGFHLSFLSIMALIYILPIVNLYIKTRDQRISLFLNIFNATFAVTILLLPYLIYKFSDFSFFSILFNMILIPFSGLILGMAFAAIMVSFLILNIAKIMGWLVSLLSDVFLVLLNIFNIINIKSKVFLFNSLFFVIIYYVVLIILVMDFYKEHKELTLNI